MIEKINWIIWLGLVIMWNYGFPQASPFEDVLVAVILSILFIIIKPLQSRYLKKLNQEVNLSFNEGEFVMGIHYDYKSTRGDKAMKKEAKRKARIEQRRARKSGSSPKESEQDIMHDINKPITLEDLTESRQKLNK